MEFTTIQPWWQVGGLGPRARWRCGVVGALVLGACAAVPRAPEARLESGATTEEAGAPSALGIEVVGLRLTAAGAMLDFRYRVVDASRAARLLARGVRPIATAEGTGLRLGVPSSAKVGPLRTSRMPPPGRTASVIFGNPGRAVKRGDRLTITWGEVAVSGLTVQ